MLLHLIHPQTPQRVRVLRPTKHAPMGGTGHNVKGQPQWKATLHCTRGKCEPHDVTCHPRTVTRSLATYEYTRSSAWLKAASASRETRVSFIVMLVSQPKQRNEGKAMEKGRQHQHQQLQTTTTTVIVSSIR